MIGPSVTESTPTIHPLDAFIGAPGYGASADGRVWTRREKGRRVMGDWNPIKPCRNPNGYMYFASCGDRGQKSVTVHRAVWAAFNGPIPTGLQVCHNNGIKTDNRIENLRVDTAKGNMSDCYTHGTIPRGERHGASKLTSAQVVEIRSRVSAGETQRAVAAAFGVCFQNVNRIVLRYVWKHI